MARIYISYRRDDTRIPALALHAALKQRFPGSTVFLDAVDIPFGVDFQRFIDQQIAQADLMLVLIGYNWLGTDAVGRAIDQTGDYVRREVEEGLAGPKFAAGKTVVPVLVNGASMPPTSKLPISLQVLASLHAIVFNEQTPDSALDALAPILSTVHTQAPTAIVPPSAPTLPAPPPPKPSKKAADGRSAPAAPPAAAIPASVPSPIGRPMSKPRRRSRPLVVIVLLLLIMGGGAAGLSVFIDRVSVPNPTIVTATPNTPSATITAAPSQQVSGSPGESDPGHDSDDGDPGRMAFPAQAIALVTDFSAYLRADPVRIAVTGAAALLLIVLLLMVRARRRAEAKRRSAFLSYQRTSGAMAVAWLSEGLDKQGIAAFYDGEMTGKAGHFPSRLKSEIETRDVFVCVLAETTLQSEWVLQEIRFAYALEKPMIPVFLESYRRPEPLTDPAIKTLLENQGEHLLDQRGIHLDYSLNSVAGMIKASPRTRVRRRRNVEPEPAGA
ncbi:MAG: toll/interleukin-1 receptor domain-containing protein [Anaerolineae bacterium]